MGGGGAGGAGGMPGMGQQMQRATSGKPVHGEVFEITSLVQLQKIVKDYQGVVIDFWSPTCPPCMSFKPKFESACRGNPNKNIVFCTVNTQHNREAAQSFQVSSIPQFNFMLYGEQAASMVGANEVKFRENLAILYKALSGKSSEHMHQEYK